MDLLRSNGIWVQVTHMDEILCTSRSAWHTNLFFLQFMGAYFGPKLIPLEGKKGYFMATLHMPNMPEICMFGRYPSSVLCANEKAL